MIPDGCDQLHHDRSERNAARDNSYRNLSRENFKRISQEDISQEGPDLQGVNPGKEIQPNPMHANVTLACDALITHLMVPCPEDPMRVWATRDEGPGKGTRVTNGAFLMVTYDVLPPSGQEDQKVTGENWP